MRIAISKERILARRLEELATVARVMQRVIAAHIPREDPELRQTSRVHASGVDRHVDRLAVVPVGVAGVGAVEEELTRCVVGEE